MTHDCRSEDGVTVGLIDALMSISAVLADRDLTSATVGEALADLRADRNVELLLAAATLSDLARRESRETIERAARAYKEAADLFEAHKQHGASESCDDVPGNCGRTLAGRVRRSRQALFAAIDDLYARAVEESRARRRVAA